MVQGSGLRFQGSGCGVWGLSSSFVIGQVRSVQYCHQKQDVVLICFWAREEGKE